MKKIVLIVVLLLGMTGCGLKEKIHGEYSYVDNQDDEQEENDYEKNLPTFSISSGELKKQIEANLSFYQLSNNNYCYESKNTGLTLTFSDDMQSIDISDFDNDSFENNEKQKSEFLATIKVCLETLGESYDEVKVEAAYKGVEVGAQDDHFDYSNKIYFAVQRSKRLCALIIYPQ